MGQRMATSTPPGLLFQTPSGRSTIKSKRSHAVVAHSGTSPDGVAPPTTVPDHSTACGVFFNVPSADVLPCETRVIVRTTASDINAIKLKTTARVLFRRLSVDYRTQKVRVGINLDRHR